MNPQLKQIMKRSHDKNLTLRYSLRKEIEMVFSEQRRLLSEMQKTVQSRNQNKFEQLNENYLRNDALVEQLILKLKTC